MKRIICAVLLSLMPLLVPSPSGAQPTEPTIYVVQKGDTLWGLSDRFLKDPFYWPNLWARNQKITNPHLIFPGQRLRIYPDRIEIEDALPGSMPETVAADEAVQEKIFTLNGAEGYLLETDMQPAGTIIQTNNDRLIVGENDPVYTDLGTENGAKVGDTFAIYKQVKAVKHPETSEFMGYKILPLGTLRLTQVAEKSSRAEITDSYQEIGLGSLLLPARDNRRTIALKAATVNLDGFIIESRMGNITIGESDIAYLDLGKTHGIQPGNIVYVVRDVKPESEYVTRDVGTLPQEVIGALVVVETGERTSTALVVKSLKEIYLGDKVKLIKN